MLECDQADGRVQHLGGDAVAILRDESGSRVVGGRIDVGESPVGLDLVRFAACARDQAELHHEIGSGEHPTLVAPVRDQARHPIELVRWGSARVQIGGFDDVRIGGEQPLEPLAPPALHAQRPCRSTSVYCDARALKPPTA